MGVYCLRTIWNESQPPPRQVPLIWKRLQSSVSRLCYLHDRLEAAFGIFQLHNERELSWDPQSCDDSLNLSTEAELMNVCINWLQTNVYTYKLCLLTLRSGLSLVSMMNSYLQSSQQRVSELLIHCCRQDWWTKRRLPVQWHGVIRGLSSSPSQWQILREPKNTVNTKLEARQL